MIGAPRPIFFPARVYDWLLFLHLLGAVLAFAAVAVLAASILGAARSDRAEDARAFLGLARPGGILFDVGGVLLLVFGIWLAFEADYGITDEWVVAAILLWLIAAFAGTRTRIRLLRARGRVDEDGARGGGELVRESGALVVYAVAAVSILAMLLLMIFKPGAG